MSGRSRALVESMRRGLSSLRLGTTVGRDPVAMMMRSKVRFSSSLPPAVFVTFTVVEFTNAALPCTNSTLRCFESCPSPPVSLVTTLSFHPRSLLRSTLGSPNSMPQFFACSASSSSLATCSRALDGMQPRYRQTPPGFTSGSISVTFMPRSAARKAAAYPPGPPPITATRKFDVFDIVVFLSLNGQQEWLLEGFRDPAQETRGVGAIDQPVIVRERERQNQARLKFVVDPLGLHPRTRQPENRHFGMIHDRRKSRATDSAKVCDRERAP